MKMKMKRKGKGKGKGPETAFCSDTRQGRRAVMEKSKKNTQGQ